MPPLSIVSLPRLPIFEQLALEEALIRVGTGNWLLLNHSSPPAVVMGISGKPELYLNEQEILRQEIPVIKRFSGGGTVVVDEDTLFSSWIFDKEALPIAPYPEPIMRWTAEFYKEAFGIEGFGLRENDYVIKDRKCGGNAQYIRKGRWLHHTSFLWRYRQERMRLLKMPPKTPTYRNDRDHDAFLCTLHPFFQDKEELFKSLIEVAAAHFRVTSVTYAEAKKYLSLPHRKATVLQGNVHSPLK